MLLSSRKKSAARIKRSILAIFIIGTLAFPLSPTQTVALANEARRVIDFAVSKLSASTKPYIHPKQSWSAQQADNPSLRAASITHFRLCPRHLTLYMGESFTLVPLALDRNEETVHGVAFSWQTVNPNIATVSSSGEVSGVAPGHVVVRVQAPNAQASVSVEVRPGVRLHQTDHDWDLEHANDCNNPESAEINEPTHEIAQQVAMLSTEDGSFSAASDATSRSLRKLARPAVLKGEDSRSSKLVRAAYVGGSPTLSASVAALQGGAGGLIDGGGGNDSIASQATAGFNNAVGSLRFSPQEVSSGAARTRNNLGSYNYSFAAPVLSLGGRGLGVNLALIYNSRVWSKDGTTMTFNYNRGWPAAGWSFGYGRVIENYDNTAYGDRSGTGSGNNPGNRMLIQPDGSRIVLSSYYVSNLGQWAYQSTDGSFLYMSPSNKLNYPDGTQVNYNRVNNRLLPQQIEDANGNQITIGYLTPYDANTNPFRWAISQITDSLGRSIQFNYDSTTHYLTSITAPDQVSGTRTLVQIGYQTINLSYSFKGTLTVDGPASGSQIDVVKRIYYPQTGRGYLFPDYSSYGMCRRVSSRIGMTSTNDGTEVAYTSYNYVDIYNQTGTLTDSPQYTTRTEGWQTNDQGAVSTVACDYTYTRQSGADANGFVTEIDTVTNQNSNRQVITTTGNDPTNDPNDLGRVESTEYKDLSGNSLQKVTNTYVPGPDSGIQLDTTTATVDGSQPVKTSFTYGNYGRVLTVDEYGYSSSVQRRTSYTYSDDSNLISYSLKQLVTEVDVYDGGNLNTPVAKTTYSYDNYAGGMISPTPLPPNHDSNYTASQTVRGNVTTVTSWISISGNTTITRNRKYDIFGNVVQADVSCCQVKNFSFSDTFTHYSQPDSVTDGTEPTTPFLKTSFQYDLNTGLLKSVTDPNGLTTSYAYDLAWRLSTITAPQSAYTVTTQFDKDANGNDLLAYSQKTVYTDADTIQKTVWSKSWFDGAGRTLRSGSSDGAANSFDTVVATVYDSVGRVAKQSNPYIGDISGIGSPAYWTTPVYDSLSRVKEVDLQDDQPSGQRSRIQTAFATPSVTVTDQVGRKRQSQVDGLGRLTSVTEMNPTTGGLDSTNYLTTYTYDTLNNLTGVNQGGQTRSFVYDALSRMTSQSTPEGGAVSFTYTDFGAVLKRTDARAVETHYKYDTLNRPTQVWYTGQFGSDDPTATRPSLPSGVAATSDVTISYNNLTSPAPGNGQVSQIQDGAGTETYSYDSLGRAASKTRAIDGNNYQTQYQYNAINQLAVMIYPSGKRIRTNFDSRGRFSGEDKVDTSGNVLASYLSGIIYNVAGQLTAMTSGTGATESYTYSNDRLQLTRQTAVKESTTLMDLTYSYAAAANASGTLTTAGNSGQLMSVTGTINSASRNQTFNYDDLGRLVTASSWGASQRTYSYDRWGNRTSMNDSINGASQSVSLQPQAGAPSGVPSNRLTSVTNNGVTLSYVYDLSGNLTSDGQHIYQYDAEGRIATVDSTGASYGYDSANRRVKKVTGGYTTYYVWEGGQVIAEYSNATASSGGTSYYLADRLSNRMTTDASGAFKGSQDHLPFGEDGGTSGASEKHRFTNYERDGESGTDYAVNRQHQYANGRFIQADPIPGGLGQPQSLNRYAYAKSDPVNLADPLGLDSGVLGANHSGRDCIVDGFDSDCGFANALLGMDAAVIGPADTTRWNPRLGEFEYFRAFADGSSGWQTNSFYGWSAADIRRALQSTHVLSVRVTNEDTWPETKRLLDKTAKALGGRLYLENDVAYIIDVHMSYDETINKLESLGFTYFYDPLPAHKGGSDYATTSAPWLHITVGYPYDEVTRYRISQFGVFPYQDQRFRPDLTPPWITIHQDDMNPRWHWLKYVPFP